MPSCWCALRFAMSAAAKLRTNTLLAPSTRRGTNNFVLSIMGTFCWANAMTADMATLTIARFWNGIRRLWQFAHQTLAVCILVCFQTNCPIV
jgi:hypothetical protein